MDGVDWQEISSIGTLCGVGLVFVSGTAAILLAQGRSEKRLEAIEKNASSALDKIEKHEKEFSAFKADAAEKYASTATIERLEERVFAAVERMGDKFDAGFKSLGDRLDRFLEVKRNSDH